MTRHELASRAGTDTTSLVDLLDTVIDTGVAVTGDVVLSVADVDLVHLGLRLVLRGIDAPPAGPARDRGAAPATIAAGPPPDAPPVARSASSGGRDPGAAAAGGLEGLVAGGLERLVAAGGDGDADREDVQRGLAALVLTVVEVLRELMERQAVRRMEAGSVDATQIERLGRTFLALRERMDELKETFGLADEDLQLDLGPLGRLR